MPSAPDLDLFALPPLDPVLVPAAKNGDAATPELLAVLDALEPGVAAPEAPASADQTVMFDLDDLTVARPDAAIREALTQAGVTPAARKAVYDTTTIRQVVLYFDPPGYTTVLEQLEQLMAVSHTRSHTEAIQWLLRQWSDCPT